MVKAQTLNIGNPIVEVHMTKQLLYEVGISFDGEWRPLYENINSKAFAIERALAMANGHGFIAMERDSLNHLNPLK